MSFTVAIVGRPNVGKSTLFNRLVGRRLAIVDDMPGVTRDRRVGTAKLGDLRFTVIDTAGFEDVADASLAARMRAQTERAAGEADIVLFVIDAREGVMPADESFARRLRRQGRPIVLVANKSEGKAGVAGAAEAHGLGFGDPIALSAEHGEGMADLYDAIISHAPKAATTDEDEAAEGETAEEQAAEGEGGEGPIQLAIVGRPNVGKSTLVNRLVGEERLLTGPEPGITRDAIAIEWSHRGRRLRLIDTAGLRRRAHVTAKLEKLSAADTLRAVRFAHVAILVLDAQDMLEKQDLAIARLVHEEGRALVIAANKWDSIEDKPGALKKLRQRVDFSLPQLAGLPVITVSARTGQNLPRLLDAALDMYKAWNRRIPTAELNRWLGAMIESNPPPLVDGRRLKLRYMTQVKTRPPTFALFASKPTELPEAYARYLVGGLRKRFRLPGIPIRIHLRKGENPFAKSKD
jgi:GTP-binding protein